MIPAPLTGDGALRRRCARLMRLIHHTRVTGLERVPVSGRVVVALNHSGVRGGLLLASFLRRDLVFIASSRFLRFPLVREFAQRLGAIFVSPGDMLSTRIFDEAENLMRGGSLLAMMVPGRQMSLIQGPPKRGAVYLASRLNADILPVRVRLTGPLARIEVGELIPAPPPGGAALRATFARLCERLRITP